MKFSYSRVLLSAELFISMVLLDFTMTAVTAWILSVPLKVHVMKVGPQLMALEVMQTPEYGTWLEEGGHWGVTGSLH